MDSSTSTIEEQLENLSKFQHHCRVLMDERHEKERAMLETLDTRSFGTEGRVQCLVVSNMRVDATITTPIKQFVREDLLELSKKTSGYSTASRRDESEETTTKYSQTRKNKPRKFLRKGEGIKQRFKIDPDDFNLSKLPPYKFANAHRGLRKPNNGVQNLNQPKKHAMPKTSDMESNNQSKAANLDAREQHFQRILFESNAVANSTPEPKSKAQSASNASVTAKSGTGNMEHADESQPRSSNAPISSSSGSLSLNMVWSEVLDPLNIKPITVSELRMRTAIPEQSKLNETVDEQLTLFELLEQRAKEGCFNPNSSFYEQRLVKTTKLEKEDEQDSDIIPVTTEMREAQILPKITVNVDLDSSDSESNVESEDDPDEDSEDDEDENGAGEQTLAIEADESSDNDNSEKTSAHMRVRFAEDSKHTIADEAPSASQIDDSLGEMNTEMFFEHAKCLLLEAMNKNQKNISEATFPNNTELTSEEIRKLAEQSKERLAELERQIALFKENNAELLKAKQQHELEKASFIQQQEEAIEQINDEKVKMEIQLHDERLKLEDGRRKLEEKARMSKNAILTSERKEIAKLKDEIEVLRTKLRDKEQTHLAAQGRLRSQLRCFEKEKKDLYAEIERLQKDNAKLEKLNTQLSRERNMKMMHEINRNILKLAENKNTTPPPNEISNDSQAKNNRSKTPSSSRSSFKNLDGRIEVAKTLKITTSSFKQLMPNNNVETSTNSDENELEETSSNGADDTSYEHTTVKPPEANTSVSKECFKVETRETITEDGGKEIVYPNGTIRKESGDGLTIRMVYFNGDVKETSVKDGTIKYYYAKTNTWHTTYLDGLEILEFPNGQTEHKLPNGVIEIHMPNQSIKIVNPKDKEKLCEWRMFDGSTLQEMRNGDKLLILPNGQKEFLTKEFKRREYPDGTTKTVFPDGSYETRYSNGRIRMKDKEGNLILDSEFYRESQ